MRVNKQFFLPPSISLAAFSLPCQDSANLGECVSGIYSWSLAVVGIVAFVQIIYAGWIYLTAAGNTTKTGDAMKKISNAILGIVLLFSSYIILNTINPDLVGGSFGLPDLRGNKIEKVNYDRPDEEFSGDEEFALVRGRVVDSSGQPLANVKIFDDNRTVKVSSSDFRKTGLKSSFLAQIAHATTESPNDGWCLNGQACFPQSDGSCPGTHRCSCNNATINSPDSSAPIPINVISGSDNECRFKATENVCKSVLGNTCADYYGPGDGDGQQKQTTTTIPVTTTTLINITVTPGKGTLKIGQTDANGEIVFDTDFMSFLSGQFPNDVLVKDASKTVLLPKEATSISGGLTARYEWRNIKKTKTIVFASLNEQMTLDFSNVITTGLETTTTTVINQSTTTTTQTTTLGPARCYNDGTLQISGSGGVAGSCSCENGTITPSGGNSVSVKIDNNPAEGCDIETSELCRVLNLFCDNQDSVKATKIIQGRGICILSYGIYACVLPNCYGGYEEAQYDYPPEIEKLPWPCKPLAGSGGNCFFRVPLECPLDAMEIPLGQD